jgi:hypothetical protein
VSDGDSEGLAASKQSFGVTIIKTSFQNIMGNSFTSDIQIYHLVITLLLEDPVSATEI